MYLRNTFLSRSHFVHGLLNGILEQCAGSLIITLQKGIKTLRDPVKGFLPISTPSSSSDAASTEKNMCALANDSAEAVDVSFARLPNALCRKARDYCACCQC